jgi:hypothetical protein
MTSAVAGAAQAHISAISTFAMFFVMTAPQCNDWLKKINRTQRVCQHFFYSSQSIGYR